MPKQYLLTGASGFLGAYIKSTLNKQPDDVITLGRAKSNDIVCDLSLQIPTITTPVNVVIHAAGKAHYLPKNDVEAKAFFDVNVNGTKNLCAALLKLAFLPSAFIFISSVAVYGLDKGIMINENHALNGDSPYAKSKIAAELFLRKWCMENNIKLSILRLPLIAGAQPPGNLKAMINGILNNRYFNIGNGNAKKSMVMANDIADFLPQICKVGGTYNLTDGYHPSFKELAELIAKQLNKKPPKNMPYWMAKTAALIGNFLGNRFPINTDKLLKITSTLTFDDTLARESLGWKPNAVLDCFVVNLKVKI